LDSADGTKRVFGLSRVEVVFGDDILALEELEVLVRHDDVIVLLFDTQRATL
jgi:hypothetical protein